MRNAEGGTQGTVRGGLEEHTPPKKPAITRLFGLAENPKLTKTV